MPHERLGGEAVTAPRWLTIAETAEDLSITADVVEDLIRRGAIRARHDADDQIRISRLALAAYRKALLGPAPPMQVIHVTSQVDLLRDFIADAGMEPTAWLARWRAGDFEDTAENMALLIRATGLSSTP